MFLVYVFVSFACLLLQLVSVSVKATGNVANG